MEAFALFSFTAMVMAFQSEAGRLPPPTDLKYEWLDPFTVNVSWKKPSGVVDHSEVQYKVYLRKNGTDDKLACTKWRHFIHSLLTEEGVSGSWTCVITTVGNQSYDSVNESTPVSINIITKKPRAKVVKDFKCMAYPNKMNCSWIPVNQSLNLTISYRVCGQELIKTLKECDQPYSTGTRNGCVLNAAVENDICIFVDSEAGISTFKPKLVVPSPKLSIREEGDYLKLIWTPPEVRRQCAWNYEFNYSKCNEPKVLLSFVAEETEHATRVAYDKSCRYEFQSKVQTGNNCKHLTSDSGEVESYGADEPPDGTLTVVAIFIPFIVSACVILSCYFFRRHSAIICPIIPDPSAIFKEMMMNKELKTTTGKLYTPVPEPIEPCKITLVHENTVLQQNS